jgi:two-component system OmpR family sensor kinase
MKHQLGRTLPLGIRAQMTLWYSTIFAILMLLFALIFYLAFQRALSSSFDTALQVRTEQIALGVSSVHGALVIQDVTGELPGLSSSSGVETAGAGGGVTDGSGGATGASDGGGPSEVTFGTLVRILDTQGHVIYASPGFKALPAPANSVSAPEHGAVWRGTITAHDGQAVRLYSAPLSESGHVFGVVQVGEPLTSLTATLRAAALALTILTPCVLALGALGSYWLARRAFRPVHELTQTAHHIEAEDLHRRVPVPPARDEVRELAETLNAMIARLERAFIQQQRFVADASHELRTPVAAIRGLTEVTLEQDDASLAEHRGVLRAVNAEAERLGQLVSDLLALARSDEGKTQLDRVPVRLDELALETAVVAEPLARERGIAIGLETPEPVTIEGDEARLIQVVMNLLDNAIKYSSPGGQVTVRVGVDGAHARLEVRDTGRGIAAEHLPHIFERFYRADPARTRADGGSGLGLAIVERAVRAHQGTIAVDSQEGRGSTFTVTLPLAPRSVRHASPAVRPPQSALAPQDEQVAAP